MSGEQEIQREVVRLVLARERELHALERLLGSDAVAAVRTLAADGVVLRYGELLWASPALSRLVELGLLSRRASIVGEESMQSSAPRRYSHAMQDRSRRRPRDPNQLGKLIVDLATGEATEPVSDQDKDPAAVALGRKGGLKGGKARAAKMTPDERSNAARRAARARWQSKPNN